MTTIVYDLKTVASDTQTTVNGYLKMLGSKIIVSPDKKKMVWFAGDCLKEPQFSKFLFTGKADPKEEFDECDALLLDLFENKMYVCYGRHVKMEALHPVAIGSGADFARVAVYLGKSAEEAVKVASVFDSNTNNIVETYDIKKKERRCAPLVFSKI